MPYLDPGRQNKILVGPESSDLLNQFVITFVVEHFQTEQVYTVKMCLKKRSEKRNLVEKIYSVKPIRL